MRIRSRCKSTLAVLLVAHLLIVASNVGAQVDTDRDGLLDLMDVRGFDPDAVGGNYQGLGIQDLDGANLLTNLLRLDLRDNPITGRRARSPLLESHPILA